MLKRGPGSRGRGGGRSANSRGGISKSRAGSAPRTDKDGDIDMGASAAGRGRVPKSGRGNLQRNNASTPQQPARQNRRRPQVNPFDNILKVQQAIAKAQDTGDAVVRKGGNKQPREQICVTGWTNSKAASNPGGCIKELREFIERKATTIEQKQNPDRKIRITSARTEGDKYIISALPADVEAILKVNTFRFVGAELSIEQRAKGTHDRQPPAKTTTEGDAELSSQTIKERMRSMLARRYNAELKLLDLSVLGTDPEFAGTGILDTKTRKMKFFQALMSVISTQFQTPTQRHEAFLSVSLANNNLPDVSAVTSLAQTLPDIRNLDLSNNDFQSLSALKHWSRRFRSLEILLLSGNPMETTQPNYQQDIVKWFRTLRTLNNIQVRTEEEAGAGRQNKRIPLVIQPGSFQDQSSIGENFVKHFIPSFDSDRSKLAQDFYDSESTFSINVNTNAPHHDDHKPQPWGDIIKQSRNLKRITTLPARISRMKKGTEAIEQAWLSFPPTRHPDLITDSERFCIECQPTSHLPDPTGQSPSGVQGLMIVIHGQFSELNVGTGDLKAMRSFDRTIILGPGGGLGGVRVVADTLTLRSFGGFDAWIPTQYTSPPNQPSLPMPQLNEPGPMATPPQPQPLTMPTPSSALTETPIPGATGQYHIPIEPGWGVPVNGKTEEHAKKEQLALQLSAVTNMKLDYSILCLENAGWDLHAAGASFANVRATLPAEAFFGVSATAPSTTTTTTIDNDVL